jgi:hypothetical protein
LVSGIWRCNRSSAVKPSPLEARSTKVGSSNDRRRPNQYRKNAFYGGHHARA